MSDGGGLRRGAWPDAARPLHSVTLDASLCVGCTTCIKKCPVEAIRVRKGRARIIDERCVDCGECIRTCPHGAKKAVSDPLTLIRDWKVRIALPAPSLYGQFPGRVSRERIRAGILALGFDGVVEVAESAESVTAETKRLLAEPGVRTPLLSSACPAVVRLVQVRFPSLIPQLAPLLPPVEVAARRAKESIYAGVEGLGVFFLSPCAGKVTASRAPLGYADSAVDGVIGIGDLWMPLRAAMSRAGGSEPPAAAACGPGYQWARSEGEAEALGLRRSVAVDGIANVLELLEALENGKLADVDYVEALACPGGCVGGPLTVENAHIARSRVRNLSSDGAGSEGEELPGNAPRTEGASDPSLRWTEAIEPKPSRVLDRDMGRAMEMMEAMERIAEGLPGLDCGSCGAPSCLALAEDITRGTAVETDCIFKLRENVRELAGRLLALEELKPPGLDKEGESAPGA